LEFLEAMTLRLEAMTLRPTELTSKHAKAVFEAGVGAEALKDAIAVGAVFNIVTRYANGRRSSFIAPFEAGVGAEALKDAIAVGAVFNSVTRYANALDFAVPRAGEFDRAASMLLKRGYRS
jgi:alkylhydroperoxidase/carboxymuconolactone decarboxylase family protein YurZ